MDLFFVDKDLYDDKSILPDTGIYHKSGRNSVRISLKSGSGRILKTIKFGALLAFNVFILGKRKNYSVKYSR